MIIKNEKLTYMAYACLFAKKAIPSGFQHMLKTGWDFYFELKSYQLYAVANNTKSGETKTVVPDDATANIIFQYTNFPIELETIF